MGDIQAIDKTTVHRICSGQVVLSLAVAVKELVENSLDAGATVIEVRLKEYGSELIEVTDNGSGIHPNNFQGLTLKHHTSKIRDFSDLTSVETFGFRGEALSSLCALSELSAVTRHESQQCGTFLLFDRNGFITDEKLQARQVGTSFFVKNLFSSLPVRQKEFQKNLKREFHKMVQLMYAYCLVSTGVKITCSNQPQKGARTTIMSTQGSKTVRENISSLFGAKQLSSLVELKQMTPPEEELTELKVSTTDCEMLSMEGFVSTCAHGSGKAAANRQFYFINSRPCEPPKIMKVVNQVYHQFNKHQYPFIFLNLMMDRSSADVNVTPDKRQIFLVQEKLILAIIKASLLGLYEKIPSNISINVFSPTFCPKIRSAEESGKPNFSRFETWKHKSEMKRPSDSPSNEVPKKQVKLEGIRQKTLDLFDLKPKESVLNESLGEIGRSSARASDFQQLNNASVTSCLTEENESDSIEVEKCGKTVSAASLNELPDESLVGASPDIKRDSENSEITITSNHRSNEVSCYESLKQDCSGRSDEAIQSCPNNGFSEESFEDEIKSTDVNTFKNLLAIKGADCAEDIDKFLDSTNKEENVHLSDDLKLKEKSDIVSDTPSVILDEYEERRTKTVTLHIDVDSVKKKLFERISKDKESQSKTPTVRFRAEIDPSKNEDAEKELTREISYDTFEKMEIIGQFNLGFIITKLDSDLLIIDQHATDEKYNFETLQRTTTLNNQKLVVPQKLDLAPEHESILIDNLEIFNKNGFQFSIDENAPPSKKVSLTSIPMSKNVVFGKEDIDEMIFMLQDSHGSMCRPSRVRAMFASRACRKSVMIGTALGHRQMRQLVNNMGTIEQPWNCPHGRPTIRHLLNLDLINEA